MKKKILFAFLIFNTLFFCTNLWAGERKEISIVDPKTKRKALAVADEILVKFKPGVKAETIDKINEKFKGRIKRKIKKIDVYCIKILPHKTVLEMIEKYKKHPNVEYAEPNYIRKAYLLPDDPDCTESTQWGIFKIKAPQAWETEKGSSNIIIAIVDSGVDYNHSDLNDHIWLNDDPIDGFDDDGNGKIDDYYGWDFVGPVYTSPAEDSDPIDVFNHGTLCAGIASAKTDNGIGIAGVSWNSKIMVVRALDDSGYSDDSIIAPGIIYAADEGADIINLSLGGSGSSSTLEDAVDYAYNNKGCLLVAASGNSNSSSVDYPAAYDNVIAVGATNEDDERCDVSDWGYDLEGNPQGSNYGAELDVVAPGNNIYSTSLGDLYSTALGTSMAAPFVSGLAALIWSHNSSLTNSEVRDVIRSSADDIRPGGRDRYTGYGRINAKRALDLAIPLPEEVVYGIMNFPNPFRPARIPQTTICFTTKELVGEKSIDIYNLAGELVHKAPGTGITCTGIDPTHRHVYKYKWDGKNDYGERVASGIYIYVVNADGNKKVGKLAVIK